MKTVCRVSGASSNRIFLRLHRGCHWFTYLLSEAQSRASRHVQGVQEEVPCLRCRVLSRRWLMLMKNWDGVGGVTE